MKPELFQHGDLYDAEVDARLPIRVAFIALFTCCDRDGRFRWKPRELKVACLPYDDCDFSRVLDALATRGFIVRYASPDGQEYGCIPSWERHQVINNRESASNCPSPTEPGIVTRAPRVDDACPTPAKGKGREGKGTGREGEEEGNVACVTVWPDFNDFWTAYEKKGNRKTAEAEWKKLTQSDREAIMGNVPKYNASKPDKQFRKDGERYLKLRAWEDAIIKPTTSNGAPTQEDRFAEHARILRERYPTG